MPSDKILFLEVKLNSVLNNCDGLNIAIKLGEEDDLFSETLFLTPKNDIEKKEDNTSVFSHSPEDKEHILSPFTDFWPYRWGPHSQRDRFSTMIRTIIYANTLSALFFFLKA